MMEHLNMQSMDKVAANVAKIMELFPNCVTERINNEGKLEHAIDFDMLKQELSDHVVDGLQERYQFTWPDKRKAILAANAPINKTLRPCREESVDFDNTENLYIEGDNLEVLKLLQETYLGKVKMIYIDPPYNTGNDFVYEDDFKQSADEYIDNSGQLDEEGNRLVANTESNGRFHTDWLNMIYPRLKLAKDLLTDDGVIFISIDDNEQENLKKICDEIFGESNSIGPFIQNKMNAKNDTVDVQKNHEFILIYRKMRRLKENKVIPTIICNQRKYKDAFFENGRYYYLNDSITTRGEGGILNARPRLGYTIYYNKATNDKIAVADYDQEKAKTSNNEAEIYDDNTELLQKGYIKIRPPKVRNKLGCWTWELDKFNNESDSIVIVGKNNSVKKRTFVDKSNVIIADGKEKCIITSTGNSCSILDFSTNQGTNILNAVMDKDALFDNPKNLDMIKYFLSIINNKNSLILDFFSGSATTAHAVMQLNAEDGGKRKFIMVQLPEVCAENTEAYKAGYKNICEIGKERIRRAGKKIKEENPLTTQDLDIGFRVLKCDSSNMEDVYFTPKEYMDKQQSLFVDNIKKDRNDEDLLFDAVLKLDTPLSSKIEKLSIAGKTVYNVAQGHLMACFDRDVTDEVITAIAKEMPSYFVMRDSSLANDSVAINFEQIFNTYSPQTVRRVL